MTSQEILSLRDHGEVTKVQFKERIIDAYDMGCALEEGLDVTFKNEEKIHEFVIIIKREPGTSDQESVQETHQVKHQVEHQVNPVKVSLTGVQKDILNFCSIPRTAQEIMDRLGVYNQSRSRKKYIQPLVDMGVLEMTNPENPNASNQKYRKKKK